MQQPTDKPTEQPIKQIKEQQEQEQKKKNKHISVKDFASRAGVSTQRIYQMLGKELKPYCKIVDGRKYINIDGLRLFEGISTDTSPKQEVENATTTDFANILQALAKDFASALQPNTDSLNDTVAALTAQLSVKDEQIKAKDQQIAAKDEQIKQLTAALQSSQEQHAALVSALTAAQALHAGTIQERLTEHSGGSDEQAVGGSIKQNVRRGFLKRIFGRKDK